MQPMHNAHPWLISTVCVLSDGSPGLPVFVVAPTGSNTGYVGNAAVTTVTQSKLLRAIVVGPAYGNLRSSSFVRLRKGIHSTCMTSRAVVQQVQASNGQSDGTLWQVIC
jgi:hypothetical protein